MKASKQLSMTKNGVTGLTFFTFFNHSLFSVDSGFGFACGIKSAERNFRRVKGWISPHHLEFLASANVLRARGILRPRPAKDIVVGAVLAREGLRTRHRVALSTVLRTITGPAKCL